MTTRDKVIYINSNKPSAHNELVLNLDTRYGQHAFDLQLNCVLSLTGVTAIYGPSGSGKTTLLRSIAGLHSTGKGYIRFRQVIWQDAMHYVPTHLRGLAYVSQNTNLFEYMSVQDNLNYAQRRARKRPKRVIADDVISLLALTALIDRRPSQLSGGERQRVAIARALLSQPDLMLLDEPLAGVDQLQRAAVLPFMQRLCEAQLMPMLYVSHDLDEVDALADDIVHLVGGRLIQQGNAPELLPQLRATYDAHCDEVVALRTENTRLKARCAALESHYKPPR